MRYICRRLNPENATKLNATSPSEAFIIDINGMAHAVLTVNQFAKAHRFDSGLLPEFGMTMLNVGPDFLYHLGARTGIGVRSCDPEFEQERFEQYRVGLHHLFLRAISNDNLDKRAELAASFGAKIIRAPEEHDWAPGYYYVLSEDPDGIRFELKHLPGTGLLNSEADFGFADDYVPVDG